MRLLVIMAQIISTFSCLVVFMVTYLLFCTVRSQLQIAPGTTYDELYTTAIDKYNEEKWEDMIFFMENAIKEFKFYRVKLTECRVKCNKIGRIALPDKNSLNELKFFQALFKKAACLKTCKSAKLGDRPERISEEATNKFLTMMPYSYLQFAYYKQQMYYEAQCAAYTFVKAHPNDEVMKNNLDYYYNAYGAQNKTIKDLEEKLHQKYLLEGNEAHVEANYSLVIDLIELALQHYWWADDECRALCEGQYDNRQFLDLYESIASHYAHTMNCKERCDALLATVDGEVMEDYLPLHYSYLQFAYYNVDKIQEAVDCAATYLLLKPHDKDMENNMVFYEEQMGVNKYKVKIRPKAQAYWERRLMEEEMLQFAKTYFWQEMEVTKSNKTINVVYYDNGNTDFDEEEEGEGSQEDEADETMEEQTIGGEGEGDGDKMEEKIM